MPKLTKRLVDALARPPEGKDLYVWDSAVRGFGYRLKANGTGACTSIALEMPISASPRSTMGTITWSPAVGCTSTFSPAFSLSTFATAEAVVWLSVPGCSVAKP